MREAIDWKTGKLCDLEGNAFCECELAQSYILVEWLSYQHGIIETVMLEIHLNHFRTIHREVGRMMDRERGAIGTRIHNIILVCLA